MRKETEETTEFCHIFYHKWHFNWGGEGGPGPLVPLAASMPRPRDRELRHK